MKFQDHARALEILRAHLRRIEESLEDMSDDELDTTNYRLGQVETARAAYIPLTIAEDGPGFAISFYVGLHGTYISKGPPESLGSEVGGKIGELMRYLASGLTPQAYAALLEYGQDVDASLGLVFLGAVGDELRTRGLDLERKPNGGLAVSFKDTASQSTVTAPTAPDEPAEDEFGADASDGMPF